MSLKEHNDLVDKLLAQIQTKDKQIAQLNKQVSKQSKLLDQFQGKGSKSLTSVETEKMIQKRIAQLNKEHTAKVSQLNQQMKTLTQQNADLKQRLALKNYLEQKEKEHIAEVLKKNVDRKPGSQHDYKVAALISHYEDQLGKKNAYIETLKRQIKSLTLDKAVKKSSSKDEQSESKQISTENQSLMSNEAEHEAGYSSKHSVPLLQHQEAVKKMQVQLSKCRDQLQQKNKQLKEMRGKYNELTKEYYRVMNEYGLGGQNNGFGSQTNSTVKNKKPTNSKEMTRKPVSKINSEQSQFQESRLSFALSQQSVSPLQGLLEQECDIDQSITVDFQDKFKKFINRPKILSNGSQQEEEQQILKMGAGSDNLSKMKKNKPTLNDPNDPKAKTDRMQYSNIVSDILSLLNLSSQEQIVPCIQQISIQLSSIDLNESILKRLHGFLYQFGMGKVSKSDMLQVLQLFEHKCNKWVQADDLLSQVSIQVGAKRDRLLERINGFKQLQQEHLSSMRNIEWVTKLNRSNKLLEFIHFFELDQSQLQLPEQLKNIYQQLKLVNKFVKQSNLTLNIELKDNRGLENTLQLVLRKLEKYSELERRIQNQQIVLREKKKSNKV